jgi:hypothetical protein
MTHTICTHAKRKDGELRLIGGESFFVLNTMSNTVNEMCYHHFLMWLRDYADLFREGKMKVIVVR